MNKFNYIQFQEKYSQWHEKALNVALAFATRIGNKGQILDITFQSLTVNLLIGECRYNLPFEWLFLDKVNLVSTLASTDEITLESYRQHE